MYDPILVTLSKTNPIIVNTVVKREPHLAAFYKEVTSPPLQEVYSKQVPFFYWQYVLTFMKKI